MMKRTYFLTVSLLISLAVNCVTIYQVLHLIRQNRNLTDNISELKKEMDELKNKMEHYEAQIQYYSSLLKRIEETNGTLGRATINLVAIRSIKTGPFTSKYQGVTLKCTVELKVGEGRILVNTIPRIGIDLQASSRTAVLVAEKITGRSLNWVDVIITIKAKGEYEVVDGPSAGAAITIATISAIKGEKISGKVYITGTINPDGSIGKVGGILEKAKAAAEAGGEIFLVPKGQSIITVYKPISRSPIPGFTITTYEAEKVYLERYLQQLGYRISIHEVTNVTEAYKFFSNG